MFTDLSRKSAVVTGASGGLGLHFAKVLAAQGAYVTLAARRQGALNYACAQIADRGGRAAAIGMDVTNGPSVEAAIAAPEQLDIVVNSAGVAQSQSASTMSEADWDRVLDTNLKGVFLVAQAAARRMCAEGRQGAIVNIASVLGLRVAGNLAAYTASKAAVIQLTKALALEWARHGIRVNALCPGYFETDLNREFFATVPGKAMIGRIPQRRLGRPEDLDAALLLLCSDAGSYITGATLSVDGGHAVSSL